VPGPNITVKLATLDDAEGIARVCSEGWRETYKDLHSEAHIEAVIAEFYNLDRIRREVSGPKAREWGGYLVAKEGETVLGAIGGGMIGPETGEVFVLYVDPKRRGEGIGTLLLDALTEQQRGFGAKEQWVSAEKGNEKGVPFYLARGFTVRAEKTRWSKSGYPYTVLRLWRKL